MKIEALLNSVLIKELEGLYGTAVYLSPAGKLLSERISQLSKEADAQAD